MTRKRKRPTPRRLRYWISWYQPTSDYRPITDPPTKRILGWWCSGERADGTAVLCALVDAQTEGEAKRAVGVSWPDDVEWRFFNECPADWLPGDRFPLDDWMRARIEKAKP